MFSKKFFIQMLNLPSGYRSNQRNYSYVRENFSLEIDVLLTPT